MTATRLVLRQARLEQRAFWRTPDAAFFTFLLPLVLLGFLGAMHGGHRLPDGTREVTLTVPGMLAFGIIAAAYANLAARLAILRSDGVLKRIRATPLSPGVYLAGQLGSALATTLLMAAATIALGRAAFGVSPRAADAATLVAALCLGIACFAALGLAVTAAIHSPDAAGPITNATYLPLALLSGVFDPSMTLPHWLSGVITLLPVKALTVALRTGFDPGARGVPFAALAVLGAWTVIGGVIARRFFHWQP
jgi:ABC-2 type transport system permease protein